jgi:hypothetical protein
MTARDICHMVAGVLYAVIIWLFLYGIGSALQAPGLTLETVVMIDTGAQHEAYDDKVIYLFVTPSSGADDRFAIVGSRGIPLLEAIRQDFVGVTKIRFEKPD